MNLGPGWATPRMVRETVDWLTLMAAARAESLSNPLISRSAWMFSILRRRVGCVVLMR